MTDNTQTQGVDFHCHLDLYPDFEKAVARAEAANIYTLTVTTTPRAWPRNQEITRNTRYVRAALGLHPQLVAEHASELSLWKRYLPETRYVGEVGLDASPKYYHSFELQQHVFRSVLECCAEAGGKVLTVHSVRSAPAVLDLIEEYLPQDRGTVVLHWFTGSKSDARRAARLGCYFSINAEMARSERGRALVAELPIDRILTETDGPFTQGKNQPAEPADVSDAISIIANARKLSPETTSQLVLTNLKSLLL